MSRTVTPERYAKLEKVLSQRQKDLTLVLANIHDPHNVSAIYRSADAFGVATIHLYYTNTVFPKLGEKSSASARKWIDTVHHSNIESLATALTGHTVLITSCSKNAKPLSSYDFTKPTAIIMGNEHSGVPDEFSSFSCTNSEVYIPMYGMIQSFNVSVAAAIILAEASRQRVRKGMYDYRSYTDEEYESKLASWIVK